MDNLLKAILSAYRERHFSGGVVRMKDFAKDGYGVFTGHGCYKHQMEYNRFNVVAVFSAASTEYDLLSQFEAELKVNFLENELFIKN